MSQPTPANRPIRLSRRHLLRSAVLASAVVGVPSLLTACGSSGGTPAKPDGTLVFWHNYTQEPRVKFMEAAAREFEKQNPGTTVKIEVVPNAQFPTKWPAAQAADSLPDVTTILPENAVSMDLAKALNPMDDVLAALGGDDAFVAGLVNKLGRYRDKVILLPHYVHNRLLVHRKDILSAAGVTLPEKPTWDEAYEAAVKLQSPPDHYGWILNLSKADVGGAYTLFALTRSAGGRFFDNNGKAMLDTPEVLQATNYLLKIARNASTPAQLNYTIADNFSILTSGKTGLSLDNGAGIGNAVLTAPAAAAQLGSTFLPRLKQPAHLLGAFSFALPKGKNPELAREFVKFMYSDAMYVPFLHTIPLFMFPALKKGDSDAFYNNDTIKKYEPTVKQTIVGIGEGDAPGFVEGPNPYAGAVFSSHIIDEAIQSMLAENTDAAAALKAANAKVQTLMDGIRSRVGN